MSITVAHYRDQQARDMSEKELMALVIDAATALGYLCYHTFDSRKSSPGFPDCLFIRKAPMIGQPSTILVVETKTERGKVTPDQQTWLDAFALAGVFCAVVRPSDWLAGRVERWLSSPHERW